MFSDVMSLLVDGSGVWGKCVSTTWNEKQVIRLLTASSSKSFNQREYTERLVLSLAKDSKRDGVGHSAA